MSYDVPIQDYVDRRVDSTIDQIVNVRTDIAGLANVVNGLRDDIAALKVQDASAPNTAEVRQIARIEAAKVLEESKSGAWARWGVAAGIAAGVAAVVTVAVQFIQ